MVFLVLEINTYAPIKLVISSSIIIFNLVLSILFTEKSTALQDVGIAAIVILALVIVIGPVICIVIGIKSHKHGRRHGYNGPNKN